MQEYDGVYWPMPFTSRTLNEINYGIVDKEVLALLRILESLLHAAGASHDQGADEVLNVRLVDAVERLPWASRPMGSTAAAVDIGDREVADKLAGAALQRGDGEVVISEEDKLDLIALIRLDELLIPKSADSVAYVTGAYLKGEVGNLSSDEAKNGAKIAYDYEVDESDLLFYFPKTASTDEDRDLVARLVVPETLQQAFPHHYHTSLEGGHQGIGRTYHRIRAQFYW
ncbi:unnamed protein product [Phytophthora fragariaefolia]|uniref:Unnamed protein product n=1 Tax=Phytophthora fragariaefolia TaxID=1490495 RepID=A0A9W7CYT5_9STRA|nr:unnamed protein product [Phytophthora fragariaefolia]